MTERAVVGRHDVLDLVGQEAGRVDLARARRTEQQRHLAAVADRLVGEHPDAGHAEAAGHEQQVAAARVHLERPPEGARAGRSRRPARSLVNHSVPRPMTRKWIVMMPVATSAVLTENGRRNTIPEKSPVRTWTNWPAREPLATVGAWYAWSH